MKDLDTLLGYDLKCIFLKIELDSAMSQKRGSLGHA